MCVFRINRKKENKKLIHYTSTFNMKRREKKRSERERERKIKGNDDLYKEREKQTMKPFLNHTNGYFSQKKKGIVQFF